LLNFFVGIRFNFFTLLCHLKWTIDFASYFSPYKL
jgi:hypothetical protein